MARVFAAILLVTVLVIGGGIIATTAYNAGIAAGTTVTAPDGGTAVTPVVVPAYGYGWHPFGFGFGIFGLLVGLFLLFVIFGLIRAVFWGGRRRWGPGGWGGPGWGGPGNGGDSRYERNPWIDRFGPSFEEWHRQAHEPRSSSEPPASNTTSKPA